ncbi:polysaccharide biosynthesis/export family protein [Flavobacterium sp. SUN046]|uniref:polysaccharide biosynthesis/export family protein n=1 Tax=Flavobacterium sp. SUN046 TaxID=3002440 RepID=UPI002DB91CF9|nr:polysaccharide biosynthesis/export family protein [Flavobacterium sp. SUN046]MEC4049928.1 polysaccharide biosynthesis/export family protein [Flavobacterium sp. SUN046]
MKKIVPLLVIIVSFQSCITTKNTVYVQSENFPISVKTTRPFEPIIKSDNILNITVSGDNPEAAAVFNLVTLNKNINTDKSINTPTNVTYLVDNEGFIEMPLLGKIHVAGLKKSELEDLLKARIGKYLANPILFIRILNYRLYVVGEVNRSGEQKLDSGERTTIIEALSRAGDLTINGNRKRVKIIREIDGITTINTIDLTNPDFIKSDYYYLQQNDVVYVEPNKAKINTSSILPYATALSIIASTITVYFLVKKL